MTPEATGHFRSFLRLSDFANEEPNALFTAMASTAAWSFRQAQKPGPDHDVMLSNLAESTLLWMGLLSHLATVDRSFFHLARRMAAATLIRQEPLAKMYRHMAAALLVSDPPVQSKPKVARDVAILIGVAVGQSLGWTPTEAEKVRHMG